MTETDTDRRAIENMRGLMACNAGAVGFAAAFAVLGHGDARHWGSWLLPFAAVGAAWLTEARCMARRGARLTTGVAVADAGLVLSLAGTGLIVSLGSWLLAAATLTLTLAYLAWFGRRRTLAGRLDALVVLSALLGLLAYVSLQRPWTAPSAEWGAVGALAGAAALAGIVSAIRLARGPARDVTVPGSVRVDRRGT